MSNRAPNPEETLPGRSEPAYEIENRHAVLGTPLMPPFPEGIEVAYFALGCYWAAERLFWQIDGVHTTAVGFINGSTPNPTDVEVESGMTGHAETVMVAFDPAKVSYAELLKAFFEEHDPTQGMRQGTEVGSCYRSGVYFTDEAQKAAARTSSTCTRPPTPSTAPSSAPASPARPRPPPEHPPIRVMRPTRIELATFGLKDRRSLPLVKAALTTELRARAPALYRERRGSRVAEALE
jgi:methionine-S-sulfoxide reductase